MRIRTVKPEFWRSDDVAALPIEDRLLFIGLWSYVDDSGVGVDKIAHICADLFAPDLERNPTEVFGRVTGGLQKLADRGMIIRYEAEGKPFLYVTNWKNHQRIDKPSKTRYPLPDMGKRPESPNPPEDSGSTPENFALGTGEQRNRGTGEQSSSSDADASDPDVIDADESEEEAFPVEVYDLCNHLAEHITRNGNKVGKIGLRWLQSMDRLIRLDGYTPDQVRQVIDWSQANEFWQGNILSAAKLREKFDQLKSKMLYERNNPPKSANRATDRMRAGYDAMAGYTGPQEDPWTRKELEA